MKKIFADVAAVVVVALAAMLAEMTMRRKKK